jgi:hypothetical protein
MKINEILVEAEIDDLIAQSTAPEVKKPGIMQRVKGATVDRFNASAQRGAANVAQRKATPGILGAVAKGIGAVTNTIDNAPHGIPSSYAVLPKDTDATMDRVPQASTNAASEPIVAPQNAAYLRTLAKNKIATTGTDSPEVNAVIKSAGLLK